MSALLHNLNVAANCARMARQDVEAKSVDRKIEKARQLLLRAYEEQFQRELELKSKSVRSWRIQP